MGTRKLVFITHTDNSSLISAVKASLDKSFSGIGSIYYCCFGDNTNGDWNPEEFNNAIGQASAVLAFVYHNEGNNPDVVPAEIDIIIRKTDTPVFYISADGSEPAGYLSQYGCVDLSDLVKNNSELTPLIDVLSSDKLPTKNNIAEETELSLEDCVNLGLSYKFIAQQLMNSDKEHESVEYFISAGRYLSIAYDRTKFFSFLNGAIICYGPAGDICISNKNYDTAALCYEKAFYACLECERVKQDEYSVKQLINCFKKLTGLFSSNNLDKLAEVYRNMAEASRDHYDADGTIDMLDIAAFCYDKLSGINTQTGNREKALEAALLSLGARKEMLLSDNPEFIRNYCVSEETAGNCYRLLGMNGKAAACLEDSVTRMKELYEKTGNPGYAFDYSVILLSAATTQYALYNIALGREYYDKAIKLRRVLADNRRTYNDYLNLAYAYYSAAQLDKSIGENETAAESVAIAENVANQLLNIKSCEEIYDLILKLYIMMIEVSPVEEQMNEYKVKGIKLCEKLYFETGNDKYKKISSAFK